MKLESVSPEEMNKIVSKKKRISNLILEFWKSDLEVVRVDFNENDYKHLRSAQASFSKSAKNMKVGVFAVSRKGKLYLVKEKI